MDERRLTPQTTEVLVTFLEEPGTWHWGAAISRASGLKTGTIYPILARLEHARWLESKWEQIDASEKGRPKRRLYRLTGLGLQAATSAVEAQFQRLARVRAGRKRPPTPRERIA